MTNDNSRTRFRFKGKAKINSDWEAGYLLEIGVRSANSKRFKQDDDTGSGTDVGLDIRDSAWFVKSKTYGGLTVGLTSSSTDAITEVNLTQTSSFSKYSDVEDTGLGLLLRSSVNGQLSNSGGTGISFRRLLGDSGDQPGEGERRFNQVKYDTPTFKGFSASASWGEDDFWDVALRYAGEFGGFKLAAGVGYLEITDGPETKTECSARGTGTPRDESCQQFGGSISVIHEASGLFVNFGAGQKKDDVLNTTSRFDFPAANPDDKQSFWAVQTGIEKKFNEFGKTTIYGEYYDYSGGAIARLVDAGDPINPNAGASAIWDTGLQVYGAGIAQGFDNASLVVYLSYRHVEADLTVRELVGGSATGAINDAQLEDLDLVLGGAIIKF